MTSPKSPDRLDGRTKIITVASIGAVGLAGIFAIGANLGILSGADHSDVGTVAAAGDLLPVDARVVDVYLDEQGNPLPTDLTGIEGSQRFTVDSAGTVDVSSRGGTVHVDLVTPASGWTAEPAATTSGAAVTFTDGTRTLEFTASVGPDGTLAGDVTEAPGATSTVRRDDDRRSDDDDEHDDEHEESEEHEYEGGDSDD